MRNPKDVRSVRDRRVSKALQALHTNPHLSVYQLAKTVGLSESRLQHLIAEQLGITIRELKSQMRIERLYEARRQLIETFDRVIDIQERAGYIHESNFRRDFKKLFHRTPAVWRREEE